ncbi:type II toxin-antitoxin system VapC family toxin [Roseomonas sp. CCTCC AB2023176]|uniref:type II toxin-antitoxin system VapC family toxin n=1 Tax=Roseomonas sp. CCTCC AB2023176 TaxID=3342640 RepID=UPI0035DB8EF7
MVPLFRSDFWTDRAGAFLSTGVALVVSYFAAAELSAVITREVRMRPMTRQAGHDAFDAFDEWRRQDTEPAVLTPAVLTPAEVSLATVWLRRLDVNLRAPDALHLAMASRLALPVLTCDKAMATAARALGMEVADP